MSRQVALATCQAFPQLTDEDLPLLERLREIGIEARPAVWDDPAIDWHLFDLVVIRSTWDYALRRDLFVEWARSVPRLLNNAEIVAWNTDKRYLSALEYAVPTRFLAPGEEFDPPGGEYVIKPAISAGSRDTARYGPGGQSDARAHARALLSHGRAVMVQPYLGHVDTHGETALVFIGGSYSHAIRKGQMLHRGLPPSDGLYVEEDISPRLPGASERRIAEETLDSLPWPRQELLYARVDLIHGPGDEPSLVELELTEPSLFFEFADPAVDRMAEEIASRL